MSGEKIVLVTGASSGLGAAFAAELARRGHRVYGTSRQAPLSETPAPFPVVIPMDVRDERSVGRAVEYVLAREGRLDVVVNNAGVGLGGAVEDTTPAEALEMFETNFFGVHRVCRAVLPAMRAEGRGLVVNVGSIAGEISIPFQAFYSATKAALAALTEALRIEVRPFGIDVTLLEPGDFRTGFTANRKLVATTNDAYRSRCGRAIEVMERDERNGADPDSLARLLARLVGEAPPRPRYVAGLAAQRLAVLVKRLAPARFSERLLAAYYGV